MARRRSTKLDALKEAVRAQAKNRHTGRLDLATSLLNLKTAGPREFKAAVAQTGLSIRTAYHLVKVADRLRPFRRHRSRLEAIGWTKLAIIAGHITRENARKLLNLAEETTAHQLAALMRDEGSSAGTHTVLLRLSPDDYERFAAAILQHGGQRARRGLQHQEKALMRIIGKVTATERE